MKKLDHTQLDFFLEPVFPVRDPAQNLDLDRYRTKLKRAMARAIRECPYDRPTIAARMAQYLGLPSINKATLDAYTAESKAHDITMPRFAALAHATDALWLWDEAASLQGVTMLIGEEAVLAEIAYCRQEQKRISAELKRLTSRPIRIQARRKA